MGFKHSRCLEKETEPHCGPIEILVFIFQSRKSLIGPTVYALASGLEMAISMHVCGE